MLYRLRMRTYTYTYSHSTGWVGGGTLIVMRVVRWLYGKWKYNGNGHVAVASAAII
jgi:hypothetical protein